MGYGVPGGRGYPGCGVTGCGVTGVGGTSLQILLQHSVPPAQFCPVRPPRLWLGKGALLGPGSGPGFWQALGPVTSALVQAFTGRPRPEHSWAAIREGFLRGKELVRGGGGLKGGEGLRALCSRPWGTASWSSHRMGWFLGGWERGRASTRSASVGEKFETLFLPGVVLKSWGFFNAFPAGVSQQGKVP